MLTNTATENKVVPDECSTVHVGSARASSATLSPCLCRVQRSGEKGISLSFFMYITGADALPFSETEYCLCGGKIVKVVMKTAKSKT